MKDEPDEKNRNPSQPPSLAAYEKAKFVLAEVLHLALADARKAAMRDQERECQELLSRLAGDRFYVAVLGHFNRGKTTLMNAMAGIDRLPTGILPATSVITGLCYGSRERVLLRYRDRHSAREIALEEIACYISEQGNPGNWLGIELAEVQMPAELLRRGLFLVDTPGLGSAIAANTKTTESFLPRADAILFVTSVEAPLSSEEISLLRRVSQLERKLFLVLNKTDLVPESTLQEITRYVREQVAKQIPEPPPVATVSARRALEARISGNPAALSESQLPALEASLVAYLAADRWQDFLHLMLRRTETLLAAFPAGRAEPLLSRLAGLEAGVPSTSSEKQGTVPARPVIVRPCAVCERIAGSVFRFLSEFQYELASNERTRSAFAEQGGFCAFHGRQYAQVASPAGIATAIPPLLESLSVDPGADGETARGSRVTGGIAKDCPACKIAGAALEAALQEAAGSVEESAQAPDLCLAHSSILQSRMEGTAFAREVRDALVARLARLAEDLKRFALKQDGLRRDLISEEERNAPGLSLNLLFGHKDVQPRRSDSETGVPEEAAS